MATKSELQKMRKIALEVIGEDTKKSKKVSRFANRDGVETVFKVNPVLRQEEKRVKVKKKEQKKKPKKKAPRTKTRHAKSPATSSRALKKVQHHYLKILVYIIAVLLSTVAMVWIALRVYGP